MWESEDFLDPINKAILEPNIDDTNRLLYDATKRLRPNQKIEFISAYLHHSLEMIRDVRQFDIIMYLLELGANVNYARSDHIKAIHFAAMCITDRVTDPILRDVIYELIKYGANVNDKALRGNTALMFAIETGNLERIQQFLELGADTSFINIIERKFVFYSECMREITGMEYERILHDYRSTDYRDKKETIDYIDNWKRGTTDVQMTRNTVVAFLLCLPQEIANICGEYIHLLPPEKRGTKRKIRPGQRLGHPWFCICCTCD